MDVSKNRGKTTKMDGENNGKPYEQMDDLGGFPIFSETPIYSHLESSVLQIYHKHRPLASVDMIYPSHESCGEKRHFFRRKTPEINMQQNPLVKKQMFLET